MKRWKNSYMKFTLSIYFKYVIIRLIRFISKRIVIDFHYQHILIFFNGNMHKCWVRICTRRHFKGGTTNWTQKLSHWIFQEWKNVYIFSFWLWVWVIITLIESNVSIITIKYIDSSVSKVSKMHCNKKSVNS